MLPRSTASAYWMRSFVPMLKKSDSAASLSATIAAEGISIMTPTGTFPRNRAPSLRRLAFA